MANRQFDQYDFTLQKRVCHLWAVIAVPSGTTPVLQKWNYPTLGAGTIARTYSAAPSASALPSGNPAPLQYNAGAEGIRSVTRTGVGLWTVVLQDNYQRILKIDGEMSTKNSALAPNIMDVCEDSGITNMPSVGGSIIGLQLLSANGTVADPSPAASTLIRVCFSLHDASEP